jgi:hypothetical protein
LLIGFGHRKQVGKDYIAAAMPGFRRVAFADAVRDFTYTVNPWVSELANVRLQNIVDQMGWEEAKRGDEVRRLLIAVGAAARDYDPDFWVNAALWSVDALEDLGHDVVITDVRYPNEVKAIKERQGHVIRIDRPSVPDTGDSADDALAGYDEWDAIITNTDGPVEDLVNEVLESVS